MSETQPRKLVAILAADIAGYSALMGSDELGTVRDLKAHQAVVLPKLTKFGGRVIDTAGDGILGAGDELGRGDYLVRRGVRDDVRAGRVPARTAAHLVFDGT